MPYPRTVMKNKKLLARSGSRSLGTVRRNAKAFRSRVAGEARFVLIALGRARRWPQKSSVTASRQVSPPSSDTSTVNSDGGGW